MRATAKVTKTGIAVYRDGTEAGAEKIDLRDGGRHTHGVNLDVAEMNLEWSGLLPLHWFWNAKGKYYITLLGADERWA